MLSRENLHKYQDRGVSHIIDNPFCGLFLDMGLGKTVTSLTAFEELKNVYLSVNKGLIIGPKRVVESVWSQEVEKWAHTKDLKISKVIGSEPQRIAALKKDADLYLVSRDNIAWLCAYYGGLKVPMDMLIIDESSSFKNPKSVRFKALKKVRSSFSRIVILTGTPAPNSLMDLWAQMYLVDGGERLGRFITEYRGKYFRPEKQNGHIVYKYGLRKGAETAIRDKIKDVVVSMKAKDYLDIPKRRDVVENIELPDKLSKKYKEFEREKILEMFGEGEEITALNAAALANKLLQFASGAIYDADKNVKEIHRLKIGALEDHIEALQGRPLLVAWNYRHDRDRIMSQLRKHKPVEMKCQAEIDAWNRGEIKVMLMHPASGGHGLNLQKGGSNIFWFGPNWSLELEQQFNARVHRQGQERETTIAVAVCKGTIEERVVEALNKKNRTQEDLINSVKVRIKEYLS